MPDAERARLLGKKGRELVVNATLHVDPVCCDAGLAGVSEFQGYECCR
jgi:hypothetical protein